MRHTVKALLLSTVFIAASSMVAQAGGLMEPYGGLKDGGYSAPAPVPTFGGGSLKDAPMMPAASGGWYIRGDIGYSSYGNVGGYIGESSMYVGSNQIGTDGTFVGDFDGSCNLSGAGDYKYADSAYVYDTNADGTYVLAANGSPTIQVVDANGVKSFVDANTVLNGTLPAGTRAITNYTDANGNAIEADGYIYFNNAETGASIMRFNPSAQYGIDGGRIPQLDAGGNPIVAVGAVAANIVDPIVDANGVVYQSVDHPNVDGSSGGIWEVYSPGANTWTNVAATYYYDHDGDATTAPIQKVLVWDNDAQSLSSQAAGGAWGSQASAADGGTVFTAQTMIDVVRGFAATIPAEFLKTSTNPASSREQSWLNMAALAAGRSTCNMGRQALTSASIDDTWTIGGGVGYYFTSNWRGDLTFDHRASSDLTVTADHLDEWGVAAYTTTRTAELSSFVALANLYYDFGDRNSFTPYIGAGIGFSVNSMSGYDQACYDNTNDTMCMKNLSGEGASNTSVAAAAMVGFTKSLSNSLKLDVGYRYLYLGDAKSGDELSAAEAGGQGQLVLEDLTAHELRVGIRYDFGCGTCR